MLTTKDIERVEETIGGYDGDMNWNPPMVEVRWLADQLLKADAFNKELLNQIYQLRATLKMVL